LKIGLPIVLIVLFLPKVFSPIISDKNHYIAASIDKEKKLKSIKQPKIILIGGSGTAYSIDSKAIEESLKMPVVNMGLAFGLGLTYMLEEAKEGVQKGDKIIVIPEYNLPLEGNKKLLSLINDLNPNAKKYFKFSPLDWLKFKIYNFQRVGSSLFYNFKNAKKIEITNLKSAFNNHGDMVAHLNLENKRPLKDKEKLYNNLYTNELEALNNFVDFTDKKGATTYFSFPAYPANDFIENKEVIHALEKQIRVNFKGKLLNKPENNLYPEIDFFDTVYHLNKNGRDKRTKYLIEVLKNLK
jgi:hypothetical protein